MELGLKIGQPLVGKTSVHGVEDSRFFVENNIRIISYAVGDDVLPLKEVEFVVVDSDVFYGVRNAYV